MSGRFAGLVCRLALLGLMLAAGPAMGLSEEEIRARYLGIAEESVKHYEALWTDDSASIPNSGFFDFRKYGNWEPSWYAPEITVPGNGVVVFTYAVLLAETEKATFTDEAIPRERLLEHALKAIRWCCLTSAYADRPYKFPIPGSYATRIHNGSWVRPVGHRTDVLGWLTVGSALLWDKLDEGDRRLVESVCIGAAPKQRYLRAWENRQGGNQDVVKQDLGSTIGAAYLFPERSDAGTYLDLARAAGIDMVSTLHDQANGTVAQGKKVREWAGGWNLYQDYSSDHHGWSQVWYGSDKLFEGLCYVEILSRLADKPVPETYTYPGNGFEGILDWTETLCLPESEPASVHGVEYDSYYGAGLLAYCYAATRLQDPISAALEDRAAALLERHGRSNPMYDYHRNSSAKAAAAYLLHQYQGPRPDPVSYADAWEVLNGTLHYRWQQALIHRAKDRWASFSWGSISRADRPRPTGFLVPTRRLAENLDPLVYMHPSSLAGEVSFRADGEAEPIPPAESVYQYTYTDNGFQTAGVAFDNVVQRYYAAWSFDEGPYVCFAVFRALRPGKLSWTGMPVYFYVRPGLTETRRYHDAEGNTSLEQAMHRKSDWWCVAGALGLIASGGNGQVRIERGTGNNWARTAEYRDKWDGVFVSPVKDAPVGVGDVAVDLAAALYPDRAFDRIAASAQVMGKEPLALPTGWKGLVAPDVPPTGKRFVAAVNLYGKETHAVLNLTFPEGAPILSQETMVRGKTGTCTLNLEGMETFGQSVNLYAEALEGKTVFGRRETPRLYEFQAPPGERARLRLRYCGRGASAMLIRPSSGEPSRRIRLRQGTDNPPIDMTLSGVTYIGIEGPAHEDLVGPAVEIARTFVREDGRVTVEVSANDQSGVQSVELMCDGQPLGRTTITPYVWTHRPAYGYHTYQALAVDASAQTNTRSSFKRTILVAPPEGSAAAPANP